MSLLPLETDLIQALRVHAPPLLRWAGALAKQLRKFNIKLEGKSSGSSNTDALTLADLTVQELLVCGLRDADPIFHRCRLEAEEANGDVGAFDESRLHDRPRPDRRDQVLQRADRQWLGSDAPPADEVRCDLLAGLRSGDGRTGDLDRGLWPDR